ncbi:hypothetical protein GCM10010383_37070 [Streptomyces lomondensis]|uniref:Uncharacterized protein n=1 Tax=Streptomyces lomondensis TaxID=68229 RepID=A0ABQ2X7R9_9ACTN|nr:hypothetical protein GCM10010383_37070 [Streptomyces lomondensis]
MSRSRTHHEAIEQRLREALAARADTVDSGQLRPALLPAAPSRWSLPLRRTALVLLGLAAAAACALFAVTNSTSDSPARPAGTPPHSVNPPTSPAPASPASQAPPSRGAIPERGPAPASPAATAGR